MSTVAIKKFIYEFLTRETGLTVIEDLQGKPRPPLPYVTFRFLNTAIRVGGMDDLRANGSVFSNHGLRTSTISINIFGTGANDRMSALQNCLDLPEVIEEFSAAGVSHTGEDGPRDLSELMETKYQERSQFDLAIMYGFEITSTTVPIEAVEITGEVDGQGQPGKIEVDLEVEL